LEEKTIVPYGKLLRFRNLWLGAIYYFFIAYASYVFNVFMVTYGSVELKFPLARAAHLGSIIAFSGIAGVLLLPSLSDYIGKKRALVIINGSMALSILLIIWAGTSWPALVVSTALFGVFYAAVWPVYAAAPTDFFPRGVTGSVLGFWTLFYGLALVLAPALGGYMADLTGTFISSFLTGAISGALAILFLLPMRKSSETPENSPVPPGPDGG